MEGGCVDRTRIGVIGEYPLEEAGRYLRSAFAVALPATTALGVDTCDVGGHIDCPRLVDVSHQP